MDGVAEPDFDFRPLPIQLFDIDTTAAALLPVAAVYRITLAPLADLYARGHEPAGLLRSLAHLGDADLATDIDAVPPLAERALSRPNLLWRMQLSTMAPREDIDAVFDFVGDDAEVAVTLMQDDPPPQRRP